MIILLILMVIFIGSVLNGNDVMWSIVFTIVMITPVILILVILKTVLLLFGVI